MIGNNIQKFCCEDISLIENYKQAISDTTQTWDCHHRLETDLGLTRDELIKQNKYFNVPASELIFLTRAEHVRLHSIGRQQSEESNRKRSDVMKIKYKGKCNPMYGKHQSEESNKKRSEKLKGKSPTNRGKHRVYDENGKFHYEQKKGAVN